MKIHQLKLSHIFPSCTAYYLFPNNLILMIWMLTDDHHMDKRIDVKMWTHMTQHWNEVVLWLCGNILHRDNKSFLQFPHIYLSWQLWLLFEGQFALVIETLVGSLLTAPDSWSVTPLLLRTGLNNGIETGFLFVQVFGFENVTSKVGMMLMEGFILRKNKTCSNKGIMLVILCWYSSFKVE